MNISLTPELTDFVKAQVASGMYHSASEVVRDGLRLLKDREQLRQMRLEELRKEIAVGIEQLERGEWVTSEEVFRELRERNKRFAEGGE
jgi:antitoxin ParD1/3/4